MQIVIDISEEEYKCVQITGNIGNATQVSNAIFNGTPLPKSRGRKFEEIVVEYPPAELCTYPEYRDKPYFSIKYEINEEHYIGFGTYKPEVFSRYLKEYFIMPTIIEADKEE